MSKKYSDVCQFFLRKLNWVEYDSYISIDDDGLIDINYHMNNILNEYKNNPEENN